MELIIPVNLSLGSSCRERFSHAGGVTHTPPITMEVLYVHWKGGRLGNYMTMALAESMPNCADRSKSVLLGLWETQVLTGVEKHWL